MGVTELSTRGVALINKVLANGCLVNESRSDELLEDFDLNEAGWVYQRQQSLRYI